jgi:hypothetical protein
MLTGFKILAAFALLGLIFVLRSYWSAAEATTIKVKL